MFEIFYRSVLVPLFCNNFLSLNHDRTRTKLSSNMLSEWFEANILKANARRHQLLLTGTNEINLKEG